MESKGFFETLAATPPEGIVFLLVMLWVYMLPTILAFSNGSRTRWDIVMINVALGWSGLFWLLALVFAMARARPAD
ncbi:superinfection immunity protein [Singulisphaera sp. PoT]|uniref:superinfection immunity protein n=1 Tax=Singulisphaera sp. PoT TaxID=3411797 RepID=UPI003BF52037